MPIRAVAFDADDTLWDFRSAMTLALELVIEVLRTRLPVVAEDLTVAELADTWERLHEQFEAEAVPGARVDGLRPRSFEVVLADRKVSDADLVAEMARTYFEHRHGKIALFPEVAEVIDELGDWYVLGLVSNGNTDPERGELAGRFSFRLAADAVGIRKPDRRIFAMAAAAAGCHPSELAYVGDDLAKDVVAPQEAGCRAIWINRTGEPCPPGVVPDATIADLTELPAALARMEADETAAASAVGVGPHPEPWPDDERLDLRLLADGDRRNVVDRYRYWTEEAIVADLDGGRHPFHVAVENWRHDRNIGAVVRNANAFGAAGVHIVGRRRWNRRGAMATDRYLAVQHHDTIEAFALWAEAEGLPIVGIDNIEGSVPIETVDLPERVVLLFGQEGPGLSAEALEATTEVCAIAQYGSTRSVNAGVASGIAMHTWIRQHAGPPPDP